jgi:diaminohydroxyphosphoribosylaminopyrimidine deaminase / 5-amino-6-(5-phosphoribosylamino)uracil reductase
VNDQEAMRRALALGATVRRSAPPNPWVGAVIIDPTGVVVGEGATAPVGSPHAEVQALEQAGLRARGATVYVTLEPCSHVGRTGPCTQALIDAGVARVVVAVIDPDERVRGRGLAQLEAAGVEVVVGVLADETKEQLQSYCWHRETGRPFVWAKVAATLDGRAAMADGTSQWITGAAARLDGHALRADADVIVVGAGTVRADNPRLTARLDGVARQPRRIVLGTIPDGAACLPATSFRGDPADLLDELGREGVVQVLLEGGPRTVGDWINRGLVQRVAWYVAPALAGTGLAALGALETPTLEALRRGRFVGVRAIGEDVRLDLEW